MADAPNPIDYASPQPPRPWRRSTVVMIVLGTMLVFAYAVLWVLFNVFGIDG